jgi:hypothetical protein
MKKILLTLALIAATTPAFAQSSLQNASVNQKNDQWLKYVAWVGQTSARQNNGKSIYNRLCEPEHKSCAEALFYYDANKIDTMVREIQDIDGKPFKRDVCRFNKTSDVRTCVDWYSEVVTREMKDVNGKWIFVQD